VGGDQVKFVWLAGEKTGKAGQYRAVSRSA